MIDVPHNSSLSHQRIKVLLYVEDDGNDCLILQRMARKLSGQLDVRTVGDGQDAVEWLSGKGIYAERNAYPLPDLVVVDLRMPRMPGLDLLRWVRNRPEFEKLPVVVYSDSIVEGVEQRCKDLGATQFIGKTAGSESLYEFLRAYTESTC